MVSWFFCVVCFFLASGSVRAEQPVDKTAAEPVIEALMGQWEGTGTVFGKAVDEKQVWTWTLGGQFIEMRGERSISTENGIAKGELLLLLKPEGPGFRGVFLNSVGAMDTMTGSHEGMSLTLFQERGLTRQGGDARPVLRGVLQIEGDKATLTLSEAPCGPADDCDESAEWTDVGELVMTRVQ